MFDSGLIVQSAVSAFNNAALVAPAFFWWALLMVPLYVLVYYCGDAFLQRIGWTKQNMLSRMSLTCVVMALAWLVLFGGNYAVLRDGVTILPGLIAGIVFVASMFIAAGTRDMKWPSWHSASRGQRLGMIGAWGAVILMLGLSDTHTWWGPLVQIGAWGAGWLCGRVLIRREMRPVPWTVLVMFTITVAMLMQPEFFRFGQLGTLTPMHMVFLILMAMAVAATLALRNVRPRGRIRHAAYVKLKWLARFVALLCVALFMLTESVPVFLGMTVVFFAMFALAVWHAESIDPDMDGRAFALSIGVFGILTVMPVLTALAILYWTVLPGKSGVGRRMCGLL